MSNDVLVVLDQQFLERKDEFKSILPANVSVEKFMRVVKTAAIKTPDLLRADRASLFLSCFQMAQDGLLADGREAALVIYNTKQKDGTSKKSVQYMPMLSGILKKIRNSGELASISAHAVYKNDKFEYMLGDDEHITHIPTLLNKGEFIGVYAIAKTKDGAIYREVMSVEEIDKVRQVSRSKDSGPWVQWYEEMARKTVIRRLSKRLPMSTDIEEVIHRDDELYDLNSLNTIVAPQQTKLDVKDLNNALLESDVIDITNADETEIDPAIIAKAQEMFKE